MKTTRKQESTQSSKQRNLGKLPVSRRERETQAKEKQIKTKGTHGEEHTKREKTLGEDPPRWSRDTIRGFPKTITQAHPGMGEEREREMERKGHGDWDAHAHLSTPTTHLAPHRRTFGKKFDGRAVAVMGAASWSCAPLASDNKFVR